jgi:hypothetical protein
MLDNIIVAVFIILLAGGVIGTIADYTTGQTSTGSTGTIDSYTVAPNLYFGTASSSTNSSAWASFLGETFTIPAGHWRQIQTVQFFMNQSSNWAGAIVAQIWNIQGTPGINARPVGAGGTSGAFPAGAALADSSPVTAPLTSAPSASATTFSFPTTPILAPGNYAVSQTENSSIAASASSVKVNHAFSIVLGTGETCGPIQANCNNDIGTPPYLAHNAFCTNCGGNGVRINGAFWFTLTGLNSPNQNILGTPGFVALLLLFPTIFIIGVVMGLVNLSKINREGL